MLGLGSGITHLAAVSEEVYTNTKSYDGDASRFNAVNTQYDPQTLLRSAHSWSMWLKPDDGRPSTAEIVFGLHNNSDSSELYYLAHNADGTLMLAHMLEMVGLDQLHWLLLELFLLMMLNQTLLT